MSSALRFDRAPLRIYWELTRACDLACRHCRALARPEPDPAELTATESLALVDRLAGFGALLPHLILTGGDPLKRTDLFCLISAAQALGFGVSVAPSATPLLTPNVVARLNDMTNGKGPEKCIDSVGMEAHATSSLDAIYDRAKQAVMLESDRPHVLRQMIMACRPAGILSIPGVYGGLIDKVPFGAAMNKGLTFRMGQTHVNRWTDDLLRRIEEGQIDPSFVITHTVGLEQGPEMYRTFRDKQDGCIKVMIRP